MICIKIIGQYGYIVCVIIGTFLLLYQKFLYRRALISRATCIYYVSI